MAATVLPNRDRRIYFQDAAGNVREAQYSASSKTWNAPQSYIVSDKAANGTSLAADSARVLTLHYSSSGNWSTVCISFNPQLIRFWMMKTDSLQDQIEIGVAYMTSDDARDTIRLSTFANGVWDHFVISTNGLTCLKNTNIGYIIAQNLSSNPSPDLGSDAWHNLFFQP